MGTVWARLGTLKGAKKRTLADIIILYCIKENSGEPLILLALPLFFYTVQ